MISSYLVDHSQSSMRTFVLFEQFDGVVLTLNMKLYVCSQK